MSYEGSASQLAPELRLKNPCVTLDGIAEMISKQTGEPKLSRERIRQILASHNVETRAKKTFEFTCNTCGKRFTRKLHEITLKKPLFCSEQCMRDYYKVPLICTQCGKPFTRMLSKVKRSLRSQSCNKIGFFCSTHCAHLYWGALLGNNYGFVAHPEYIRLGLTGKHNARNISPSSG